jgi:hypothetical protein
MKGSRTDHIVTTVVPVVSAMVMVGQFEGAWLSHH